MTNQVYAVVEVATLQGTRRATHFKMLVGPINMSIPGVTAEKHREWAQQHIQQKLEFAGVIGFEVVSTRLLAGRIDERA